MSYKIDINADIGEGIGNESELMPFLSSCNIACGGHAGDEDSIRRLIRLAKEAGVKIGAHPSFPDKPNFGRMVLNMSSKELLMSLKDQMNLFNKVLLNEDETLHHVKPHGALYNLAAKDESTAEVIIESMRIEAENAKLYAPFGSVIGDLALKAGINVVNEAFGDRNYNSDLSLVSRQNPKAVIHNEADVFAHSIHIIKNREVKCVDGIKKHIIAQTLCLHGDNPNVVKAIKYLHEYFPKHHIEID